MPDESSRSAQTPAQDAQLRLGSAADELLHQSTRSCCEFITPPILQKGCAWSDAYPRGSGRRYCRSGLDGEDGKLDGVVVRDTLRRAFCPRTHGDRPSLLTPVFCPPPAEFMSPFCPPERESAPFSTIHHDGGRNRHTGPRRPSVQKTLYLFGENWRRGPGSNRRIKVLQTSPLPLGYRALAGPP